jgi:hypothetical protein
VGARRREQCVFLSLALILVVKFLGGGGTSSELWEALVLETTLTSGGQVNTHTQYCTGPTLPSDTFSTSTSTSRIHDGQHPLSMATTSLQQARHFNAPEVNIALPTINTLHAMPSMSQLSSTNLA